MERVKEKESLSITLINMANLTILEKSELLLAACRIGHLEAVQALLSLKTGIEIRNDLDQTPLHLAAKNGHVEIVEALLIAKAETDVIDAQKRSPLFFATLRGCSGVVWLLLKAKANPDIQDANGNTALHSAVSGGQRTIVRILCEVGNVNAQNNTGETPLHTAAIYSQISIARTLLEKGANIEARYGDEERTPLHLACQCGYTRFAKFLLTEEKAKIEAKDGFSYTALHIAAEENQDEIVTLLTKLGANENARTEDGKTALHIAAEKDQKGAAYFLINSKSDTEANDFQGCKPLHYATAYGYKGMIKALIKWGANKNATDFSGTTPLHMSCSNNDLKTTAALLKLRANPNLKNSEGQTPLHIACKEGNQEVAQCLVNNKTSTTLRDCFHHTPIHYAAKNGTGELAKLLIKRKSERILCLQLWSPIQIFRRISKATHTTLEKEESDLMNQNVRIVDNYNDDETMHDNPYAFLNTIESQYLAHTSDSSQVPFTQHQLQTNSFPGSDINEITLSISPPQTAPSVTDFLSHEPTIIVLSDEFSQLPSSVMARLTYSRPDTIKKFFKAISEFHLPAVVPFLKKEQLSFVMECSGQPMRITILSMALPKSQELLFAEELTKLQQGKYQDLFFAEELIVNFFAADPHKRKLLKTAQKQQLSQLKSKLHAKGHFIDKIANILGEKRAKQLLTLWEQKFAAITKDIDSLPDEVKKEEPPEEFLDCLTNEVMNSPQKVKGPPSWIADRTTVEQLDNDPYTRKPLTPTKVSRLPDLKARINKWRQK